MHFRDYGGLILSKGEALVPGDGTRDVSFTTRRDAGRYVAHVLTKLTRSKLNGRSFRIEGQRAVSHALSPSIPATKSSCSV